VLPITSNPAIIIVTAVTRARFSTNKVLRFYEHSRYETGCVLFEASRLACLLSILKKN
jgi:hypothetical protein